ncbi:MAG: UDP-N-acetylmuramyl-tripeptide synthetase [Chloroflexi bacterium]|nr:UDP-N-acetylmuramyl-tripeptide synthetase [Chloroflexota bacterium]
MKHLRDIVAFLEFSGYLKQTHGLNTPEQWDLPVEDITDHSQHVQPGAIFVAYRGRNTDGHRFIPQAVARGAVAVVGERPPEDLERPVPFLQVREPRRVLSALAAYLQDFPSLRIPHIIGVTGTKGKTSVIALLRALFEQAGWTTGVLSSVYIHDGHQGQVRASAMTTPPAPTVQRLLSAMAEHKVRAALLEATSHSLDQYRVEDVFFSIGVLTNLEPEHLNYHGTYEAYRAAKQHLFHLLQRTRRLTGKPVSKVLPAEMPDVDTFLRFPTDSTLTFGFDQGDFRVRSWQLRPNGRGMEARVQTPDGERLLRFPTPGRFHLYNALAALAAAYAAGLSPLPEIIEFPDEELPEGRFSFVDLGQPFTVIYDYAHTPRSLALVLQSARDLVPRHGRLLTLFGLSGRRDKEKRQACGHVLAQYADQVVISEMDSFPEEAPESIVQDLVQAVREANPDIPVEGILPREEAIAALLEQAREGDVVLIVGKGHEKIIIRHGRVHPWDERAVIEAALRRRHVAPEA